MRTTHLLDAMSDLKAVLDASLRETLHLLSSGANAIRLKTAMAEADASLPTGSRILEPTTSETAITRP